MKFYNPFKLHIVCDNIDGCYRIRKYSINFGWQYLDNAKHNNNVKAFWWCITNKYSAFYDLNLVKDRIDAYYNYVNPNRFTRIENA